MRINQILFTLFVCISCVFAESIYTGITNQNVERNIDLSSQLATHTLNITLANTGSQSASHIFLAVPKHSESHLSFISVTDQSGASLKVTRDREQNEKTER
jgi:hypothetical protein